jgi:hypothetical protein
VERGGGSLGDVCEKETVVLDVLWLPFHPELGF